MLVSGLKRKYKTYEALAFLGPYSLIYSLVRRRDQQIHGKDQLPSSVTLQDVESQAEL